MKRTSSKNRREQKLKRRLVLIRATVRELSPIELEQVNGGDEVTVNASGCYDPPNTGCSQR